MTILNGPPPGSGVGLPYRAYLAFAGAQPVSPPIESIVDLLRADRELKERADLTVLGFAAQADHVARLFIDAQKCDQAIVEWLIAHIPRELLLEAADALDECAPFGGGGE